MMERILSLISNHTFMVVALGTGFLGFLSGIVGVFLTLRKQSLLGDAVGHAALPGIIIAFMIVREKNLAFLLVGATISGMLATWLINLVHKHSVVKFDSALSLILFSFFGLGTALLTYTQRDPSTSQAGLENFIFGQASGMLIRDVQAIAVVGVVVLALIFIFWKEFKLLTFDPGFAKTLPGGYKWLDTLLSFLTVVVIALGLESVGVVLISALLVTPAIAARQWSNNMYVVVILSGVFGFISGIIGTFFSSLGRQIPTGPTIIVAATLIVFISLFFAPKRGLIAKRLEQRKRRQALEKQLEGGNV